MNLTLREATAFMAHLSPVAPPLALSSRRRRALTSRAKPLCFEVYLIEGGQPTNADGQIIVSTGGFFFTGTEGSNPSPSSGESNDEGVLVMSRINDVVPIAVDWQLNPTNNGYKVTNLFVSGINMASMQHSEVVSVVQRNSGQVQALLVAMREKNASNGILR